MVSRESPHIDKSRPLHAQSLSYVPKGQNTVVAAAIRQIFLQPDKKVATQVWRQVADQLRCRLAQARRLHG